ncbi:MAG TPA: hypothetical protein VFS43_29845 [Polyangiaceae bacterium]|nr:hypothetical protein [Polyangiaceae bacterium]
MKARRFAPTALALAAAALAPSFAAAKPPIRDIVRGTVREPFGRNTIREPLPETDAIDPFDGGPRPDGVSEPPAAVPRLPLVSPPAPLEPGRAPEKLAWSYETEGLRVVGAEGLPPDQSPQFRHLRAVAPARPKARKKKAPPPAPRRADTDTAWVRVEGASSAPTLVAFAWQAPESKYARALSMPCRPWLEAPVRWPLRWESVREGEAGAPLWQVNDGWYDERSCQVSLERRTALRPAVLVRQGQTPMVLGARDDDAVVFLVAPTRTLQAHDLGGGARTTQGPFARVRVPVGPGLASTLVASFTGASAPSWWKRPNAGAAAPVQPGAEPILLEVRVDLSQAVAEREPTLAIQRVTDRPELSLPVPPKAPPLPQLRGSRQGPGEGGGQAALAPAQAKR